MKYFDGSILIVNGSIHRIFVFFFKIYKNHKIFKIQLTTEK